MTFTATPGGSADPAQISPFSSLSLSFRQDGSFQHWYAQGEDLANAGTYDRALRCFKEASILAPEDISALVSQAVCLIHLGQPQQALAVADRVLVLAPHHPQGWLYRGVSLQRLGRYKDAYASYARVQPS